MGYIDKITIAGTSYTVRDTVIKGNIVEPGPNLLSADAVTQEYNNVVVTYNNGHVNVSGTANNGGGRTRRLAEVTLPAGTYTARVYDVNAHSKDYPEIFVQNAADNSIIISVAVPTPADATFTLAAQATVFIGVNVVSGRVYNTDFDFQLEAGSASTEYMPPFGTAIDYIARADLDDFANDVVGGNNFNIVDGTSATIVARMPDNVTLNGSNLVITSNTTGSNYINIYVPIEANTAYDFAIGNYSSLEVYGYKLTDTISESWSPSGQIPTASGTVTNISNTYLQLVCIASNAFSGTIPLTVKRHFTDTVFDMLDDLGADVTDLKSRIEDNTIYEESASGNVIDVTDYAGEEVGKIVTSVSASSAVSSRSVYCCGKNHIKPNPDSGGYNGFTWERKSDGTIVLNGTADRFYSIALGTVLGVYNTKWRCSIQKSASNDGVYLYFNGLNQGDSFAWNAHTTAYFNNVSLAVANGTVCDNLIISPMMEFGAYPDTISYEAFSGFVLTENFSPSVTSATVDWGEVSIPENVTTLWSYDSTDTNTIYIVKSLSEVVDDLNDQVAEISGQIDGAYSHEYSASKIGWGTVDVDYTVGGFVNSTGGITNNGSFRYSAFIPINSTDKIEYNLYGYSTQVYIVTFYNSSKTYISGSGIVGETAYKSGVTTVPNGAAYVRFSSNNTNYGSYTIYEYGQVSGDTAVENLIAYTDEKTNITRTNVTLTRGDVTIIEDSIYSNYGIYAQSGGRRTEYIPVTPGDTIKYRMYCYIGQSIKCYAIAVFNSSKVKIDHVQFSETGIDDGEYTIPENGAYVIISWMWAMQHDGWFEITAASYTQGLADYVEHGLNKSVLTGKQWCCLGDSITYGANTTKTYFNYISDRTNITPWNFGASNTAIAKKTSSVTDNMATRYVNMYDDADYITVFGGTNDHGQSITIGEWGDATELTLYGAMKILCEGLVSKYIGKKIGFILPLPKYTQTGGVYTDYSYPNASFTPYIECIHDVCKRFSIPVLNLYVESGLSVEDEDLRTALIPDGLHPNAAGHEYISRKIQSFLESL